MKTMTYSQIVMFVDIEQEAQGNELTLQANIAAVGAGTGMSGNTDGLRKMIAQFQGSSSPEGEIHNRLEAFLQKKRADV